MRWSRALVAAIFVLAVAACSSPATSSGPDGNGNGNGGSSNAPASQGAPQSQDDGNGGNGGNGGSVDDIFDALIPPNSTETSKTTIGGAITASYTSTDSVESLVSHYGSAIPATGMEVFSTSNAQGATSWLFGDEAGSSFGGSVTVAPDTSGSGQAQIVVIVTGE